MKKALVPAALAAGHVALTSLRCRLAKQALAKTPPAEPAAGEVTIVQPIRYSNPSMAKTLAANLKNHPDVDFLWLVDSDDPQGKEITAKLATNNPRVTIVDCGPRVTDGRSPKTHKLALSVPYCKDIALALDDDVVLPPGAVDELCRWLADGDIATIVPSYRRGSNVWSRLVSAWVNGSSIFTYLPAAEVAEPSVVQGMTYITRTKDLEVIDNYSAIINVLTDDFAVATGYRNAGKKIVQAPLIVAVTTDVDGPALYATIMKRWFVHARRTLSHFNDPKVIGLVVVPAVLPVAGLAYSVLKRSWVGVGLTLGGAIVKTVLTAQVRAKTVIGPSSITDHIYELVADMLTPVHLVHAVVRGDHVTWRGLRIHTNADGSIDARNDSATHEG